MNTSPYSSEILQLLAFLEQEKSKLLPIMEDYDNGAYDTYERIIAYITNRTN